MLGMGPSSMDTIYAYRNGAAFQEFFTYMNDGASR